MKLSRRRDGSPRWSGKQRRAITKRLVARDGADCALCGRPVDLTLPLRDRFGASFDHVVRSVDGGDDEVDNLQLAHRSCNEARGKADARHDRRVELEYADLGDPGA